MRAFRPSGLDALEERQLLTAFAVPFSLVTPPASEVNPKFLNLTGRTESQISNAITTAFERFSQDYIAALNAYNKALAKPGGGTPAILDTFNTRIDRAFNQLSAAMTSVSHKLPFGGVNLDPVLQGRTVADSGVTDTTTHAFSGSLKDRLMVLRFVDQSNVVIQGTPVSAHRQAAQSRHEIKAAELLVRSDVNDYIHLGVTNGYFRLTRGARLPALS